jgi:AcrR family transcriptional regulator
MESNTNPSTAVSLAHVLPIAEELMAARGSQAVTIEAVAQATGYSVGALTKYFPTPNELHSMILVQHATALLKQMQEELCGIDDPIHWLHASIRRRVEYAMEHTMVIKLLFARAQRETRRPIECLAEPARSRWLAFEKEELECINLAQQQCRLRRDLSAASIQQMMRVLIEWSFEDAHLALVAKGDRSAIVWGLLSSAAGVVSPR